MSAEHLLDAIGLLDDDLIQEAEAYAAQGRKPGYRAWLAWAAVFTVMVALSYGASHLGMGGNSADPGWVSGGANSAPAASTPAATEGPTGEPADTPFDIPSPSEPAGSPSADVALGASSDSVDTTGSNAESGSEADIPWGAEDFCPAVMVDGVLYWSTGRAVSDEVDEGAAQGVTSYTSALPEADGQSNFSQDLSAKYAWTQEGLAVLMDGGWVLFDPVPPGER